MAKNRKPLSPGDRLKIIADKPLFGLRYVRFAITVLLATTVYWATLSARLQQFNSDQIANTYLFNNLATFKGAEFPSQHTFLFKWPLFWLIHLLGSSSAAFVGMTVGVVLVTVIALVAIIYKIEHRPIIFGTLCLGLASVLLMVPAQPYAGALLPVNMAMLATRNLEYILYIGSLIWMIMSRRRMCWHFWLAVIAMTLLIASDKLFLVISLGGALLALIVWAIYYCWNSINLAVNWLLATVFAAVGAMIVLWLISFSKITHIIGQSTASPYTIALNGRHFVQGCIYAVFGIFTNLGANPAYNATTIKSIPHHLLTNFFSVGLVAYVVNILILAFGAICIYKIVKVGLSPDSNKKKKKVDVSSRLSLLLFASLLVSVAAFIFTNHFYVVDARYLSIVLFTVFISLATYLSHKKWKSEKIVVWGGIILVSICFGMWTAWSTYNTDKAAFNDINTRNELVSQILTQHPVDVLVGDYWRVLPTKFVSGNKLNIMPLADCTTGRDTLSSTAWQLDLHNHNVAYLFSFDKGLTDFPQCSLDQVVASYGKPNSSSLIAGSLSHPKEMLLFYDNGIHPGTSKSSTQSTPTVVPETVDQLPSDQTNCEQPTILNIVAHQDDDLLFMNPDLLHAIKDGDCVRTIYITAGDGGTDGSYWLSREQGSQAAYATMTGSNNIWIQRIVKLADNQFVVIASPKGDPKISLIFMRLPDGNLKGEGFPAHHYQSLAKLLVGRINTINSLDKQSSYNKNQLIAAFSTLMYTYQPAEIRTQANYASSQYPDHSDHVATGQYVQMATQLYEQQHFNNQVEIPIKYYIGYPIHQFSDNVSGQDLTTKEKAFFAYSNFDGRVCQSMTGCSKIASTYPIYLKRQYKY